MLTLIREYEKDGGIYGSWLWMGEKIGISMENAEKVIPAAVYGLKWYDSPHFKKEVPILFNDAQKIVLGKAGIGERDYVEIHPANHPKELEGCLSGGLGKTGNGVYPSGQLISRIYKIIRDNNLVNIEIVEHEGFKNG